VKEGLKKHKDNLDKVFNECCESFEVCAVEIQEKCDSLKETQEALDVIQGNITKIRAAVEILLDINQIVTAIPLDVANFYKKMNDYKLVLEIDVEARKNPKLKNNIGLYLKYTTEKRSNTSDLHIHWEKITGQSYNEMEEFIPKRKENEGTDKGEKKNVDRKK